MSTSLSIDNQFAFELLSHAQSKCSRSIAAIDRVAGVEIDAAYRQSIDACRLGDSEWVPLNSKDRLETATKTAVRLGGKFIGLDTRAQP